MTKRTRRLALATVGTAVAVLAAAVPASAGTHDVAEESTAHSGKWCWVGGTAQFLSYGENFYVWDECSDGRGVRVRWRYKYADGSWSSYRYIHYTGGNNITPKVYDVGNLPENRTLEFQVGLEDGGAYVSGSYGYVMRTHT